MNDKQKILYVDMDGVLVDFNSGIELLSPSDKIKFKGNYDKCPGIFSLMLPMEGAIEAFKKANRTDLVDKEEFEVTVLKAYMPEQLDHSEVEQIIQDIIKKTGATSMKEMGSVMNQAKEMLSGKANMAEVSKIIKAKLSS